MKVKREIDPHHRQIQGVLRTVGPMILGVGLLFTAVGFFSFFQAFGSFEPPRYFWCAFIGLPLTGLGVLLSKLGYLGAIARYALGEMAPVQRDTFNVLAEETQPGVETLAHAVGRGFTAGAGTGGFVTADDNQESSACPRCGVGNHASARFCNQCGTSLGSKTCTGCGQSQPVEAQFCDQCGIRLA